MYKDLSLGRHSIKWGGKDSKRDFGLILTDVDMGEAKLAVTDVTIPYCNTPLEFDFSQISGVPIYEPRYPKLGFAFSSPDAVRWNKRYIEVTDWLLRQPRGSLVISNAPNYHFNARCQSVIVAEMYNDHAGRIEVTFKADPFRISKDWADIPWDGFSFENDYLNPSTIAISPLRAYSFYSYCPYAFAPMLRYYELSGSTEQGMGIVILNGEQLKTGIYRSNEGRFRRDDFIVRPGENTIWAAGSGLLEIDLVEEVF